MFYMDTYYGPENRHARNKLAVSQMAEQVADKSRLIVGIGGMHHDLPYVPWRPNDPYDHGWTEERLRDFLAHVDANGIRRVGIWRGDIDIYSEQDPLPWFM